MTSSSVQPNSPDAVADVLNERVRSYAPAPCLIRLTLLPQDYFLLLDSQCEFFKTAPGGGVGWFAHIYSDNQEPGYGIYNSKGVLKFPFAPRTAC